MIELTDRQRHRSSSSTVVSGGVASAPRSRCASRPPRPAPTTRAGCACMRSAAGWRCWSRRGRSRAARFQARLELHRLSGELGSDATLSDAAWMVAPALEAALRPLRASHVWLGSASPQIGRWCGRASRSSTTASRIAPRASAAARCYDWGVAVLLTDRGAQPDTRWMAADTLHTHAFGAAPAARGPPGRSAGHAASVYEAHFPMSTAACVGWACAMPGADDAHCRTCSWSSKTSADFDGSAQLRTWLYAIIGASRTAISRTRGDRCSGSWPRT